MDDKSYAGKCLVLRDEKGNITVIIKSRENVVVNEEEFANDVDTVIEARISGKIKPVVIKIPPPEVEKKVPKYTKEEHELAVIDICLGVTIMVIIRLVMG